MEENIWESNLEDGTLKKEINNLIWTYGHPLMNLKEAKILADNFFYALSGACYNIEEDKRSGVKTQKEPEVEHA